VPASFACIGTLVLRTPEPYRILVRDGHEIVNHSMTHPYHPLLNPSRPFSVLDGAEVVAEVSACQDVIERCLGYVPVGFRPPHFSDSPHVFEAMAELGFRYISTAAADRCLPSGPYQPARRGPLGGGSHLATSSDPQERYPFLLLPLECCPDHPGEAFSTYHTVRGAQGIDSPMRGRHRSWPEFIALWERLLSAPHTGQVAVVYLDPMDVVRDREGPEALRTAIRLARAHGWEFRTLRCLTGDGGQPLTE
jgi:hypothetical protein